MSADNLVTVALKLCEVHHSRLTLAREQILNLIARRKGLIKAYDLLDDLQKIKPSATPMEVYRCLDFLGEIGLLHKVEALNGFIVCAHPHDHSHFCLMLVCEHCGTVQELLERQELEPLLQLTRRYKFKPSEKTLVITGDCGNCGQSASL